MQFIDNTDNIFSTTLTGTVSLKGGPGPYRGYFMCFSGKHFPDSRNPENRREKTKGLRCTKTCFSAFRFPSKPDLQGTDIFCTSINMEILPAHCLNTGNWPALIRRRAPGRRPAWRDLWIFYPEFCTMLNRKATAGCHGSDKPSAPDPYEQWKHGMK